MPLKGYKHTEEAKRNMSLAKKNMTEETKRKMSLSKIGKKPVGYEKTEEIRKKLEDLQNKPEVKKVKTKKKSKFTKILKLKN